jgi:hypothetical protein
VRLSAKEGDLNPLVDPTRRLGIGQEALREGECLAKPPSCKEHAQQREIAKYVPGG